MQLIDTHCHIHEATSLLEGDTATRAKWLQAPNPDPDHMIISAAAVGVVKMICVGTSVPDSQLAVQFAQDRDAVWVSIGIHPHEAEHYVDNEKALQQFRDLANKPKVVAVGETGLDYHYMHSPKEAQQRLLRFQLDLAVEHNLPLIFHVREAFDDFWNIFDEYQGLRGVVHSFSASEKELEQILQRNLYVGLNGIMTFTKKSEQLEAAKKIPLERILTETDAPFLTPVPYRGTICTPKHVKVVAKFVSDLRGEPLEAFATATTNNAERLFNI